MDALWVVLYNYAAENPYMDWDLVSEAAKDHAVQQGWPKEVRASLREYLTDYEESVHVVPRRRLNIWLVPSFVDVATLAASVPDGVET